jgi:hypothetical protein
MSVTLFKPRSTRNAPVKNKYWDNQDLADFYRAIDILKQAGLDLDSDAGLTDEGDPWFVFMRPESGDVVAHFARIDGFFVAVSSVSQQVYKGKNIRQIVDQLLTSHPILLPQNKNSGRLLLHPASAISAFLAAAFILTIDDVKAKDIGQVLFNVAQDKISDGDADLMGLNDGQRSEALKGMFSELNFSNYNVAILGAALIADEIYQTDAELSLRQEVVANSITFARGKDRPDVDVSDSAAIYGEYTQSGLEERDAAIIIENSEIVLGGEEQEIGTKAEASDTFREESMASPVASEINPGETAVFSDEYQISFSGIASGLTTHPQIINKSILQNKEVTGIANAQLELEGTYSDPIPNVQTDERNFIEAQPAEKSIFDLTENLNLDSLGVAFDDGGELRLVSLDTVSTGIDSHMQVKVSATVPVIAEASVASSFLSSAVDVDYFPAEESSVSHAKSSGETFQHSTPILGHPLSKTGESLELGEAIDVVFYEGGNAEIAKFELGTDLLWFFLSPAELSSAQHTVNTSGDLILDFGELGTLTFLGMVNDVSTDISV